MSSAIDKLEGVIDQAERDLFEALRGDERVLATFDAERWRALTEVALRTFSAPLLSALLRQRPALDSIPPEVDARLARARAWSAGRWSVSVRQVEELGAALSASGVECLVLKGAHVGRLYAVPGARATGDIDLVVRDRDVQATRRCLEELGYASDADGWRLEHRNHRHLAPFHRRNSLMVEVHRTMGMNSEEVPWADAVWARAVPWGEPGGALGMEPLDALLYTCKHLALHSLFNTTNGLAGLSDAKMLVELHPPAPGELAERADQWGVRSSVAIVLQLAHDLLGARIDAALLEAVRVPGLDEAIPSAVWRLMHVGGVGSLRPIQLRTKATLNPPLPRSGFAGRRPWRAVLAYGRHSALPLLDDLRLDHPRLGRTPLAPLAYPLLWGRLAWRHVGLVRLLDPRQRQAMWAQQDRHQRVLRSFVGRPVRSSTGRSR